MPLRPPSSSSPLFHPPSIPTVRPSKTRPFPFPNRSNRKTFTDSNCASSHLQPNLTKHHSSESIGDRRWLPEILARREQSQSYGFGLKRREQESNISSSDSSISFAPCGWKTLPRNLSEATEDSQTSKFSTLEGSVSSRSDTCAGETLEGDVPASESGRTKAENTRRRGRTSILSFLESSLGEIGSTDEILEQEEEDGAPSESPKWTATASKSIGTAFSSSLLHPRLGPSSVHQLNDHDQTLNSNPEISLFRPLLQSTHINTLDPLPKHRHMVPIITFVPPAVAYLLSRRMYRLVVFHILSDPHLRKNEHLLHHVRRYIFYGATPSISRSHSANATSPTGIQPLIISSIKPLPTHRLPPPALDHKTSSSRDLAIRLGYSRYGRGLEVEKLHREMIYERGRLPSLMEIRKARGKDQRNGTQAVRRDGMRVHKRRIKDGNNFEDKQKVNTEEETVDELRRRRTAFYNDRLARMTSRRGIQETDLHMAEILQPQESRSDACNHLSLSQSRPPSFGLLFPNSPSEGNIVLETLNMTTPPSQSRSQSHNRQLSQLLSTIQFLTKHHDFQPDLITLNIVLKSFTRSLTSSDNPPNLHRDPLKQYATGYEKSRRGRQVVEHLMNTFSVDNVRGKGERKGLSWERHLRPMGRMFRKAFRGRGDGEMEETVKIWMRKVEAVMVEGGSEREGQGQAGDESQKRGGEEEDEKEKEETAPNQASNYG